MIRSNQENYGQSIEVSGDQIFWQTFGNTYNGDKIL